MKIECNLFSFSKSNITSPEKPQNRGIFKDIGLSKRHEAMQCSKSKSSTAPASPLSALLGSRLVQHGQAVPTELLHQITRQLHRSVISRPRMKAARRQLALRSTCGHGFMRTQDQTSVDLCSLFTELNPKFTVKSKVDGSSLFASLLSLTFLS